MEMYDAVREKIEKWAMQLNRPVDDLMNEWKKIYELDILAGMDELQRQQEAVRILLGRLSKSLITVQNARDAKVLVIDKGDVRIVGKDNVPVASVFAYVKLNDKQKFARITLWRDNTKLLDSIEPFRMYDVKVTMRRSSVDNIWELGVPDGAVFTDTGKVVDKQSVIELVKSNFSEIKGMEISKYVGLNSEYIIRGTVARPGIRKRDDGSSFAFYDLITDDMGPADIQSGARVRVYCDPSMVRWDSGSDIYVVGQVMKSNRAIDEEPSFDNIFVRADAIIDKIGIPYIPETNDEPQVDTSVDDNVEILGEVEIVEDDEGDDFFK